MMMKTKFITGALVALIAVACSEKEQLQPVVPSAEGLKVTASVEQPGTRTSLDGLNVKWTVGDCIYLTDGTHSAIYEAIESSTTTSFSYVSGDTTMEGDVYAYYPADAVTGFADGTFTATIPSVQPYVAGGFADGINPMTAKSTVYEDTIVLQFRNLMSFVKLQFTDIVSDKLLRSISLSSPSAALSGTAAVAVDDDGFATASVTGSNTVDVEDISLYLTLNATPAYIAVPAGNLGKMTITAFTEELNGDFSQEKTALNTLDAERSTINCFNIMQISSFTNKTLCPSAPANCYMINAVIQDSLIIPLSQAAAGWDAIKELEPADDFDKSKITTGERTIAVRWFNGATGTITKVSIDDQNLKLAFGDDCQNGANAVVDLKNGDETVWSWHLWFTDYKASEDQAHTINGQVHAYSGKAFQEGGLYYGKVMMDRNLGATITGVSGAIEQPTTEAAAISTYGLFYQFGRKDPFATTGSVITQDVTSSKVTYAFAAQAPATFFITRTASDAWASTDAEKDNEHMTDPWNSNGSKSAFDPCPTGWRIPNNSTYQNKNVWFGMDKNSCQDGTYPGRRWCDAWIPYAGYRSSTAGSLTARTNTQYWSASPRIAGAGIYAAFYPNGSTGAANVSGGSRAIGMNIRCVSE